MSSEETSLPPAPEPPRKESTTTEDREYNYLFEQSSQLPDRIDCHDIPHKDWVQRLARYFYEERYRKRFNVLVYSKEIEPQMRMLGLIEGMDIKWHDCNEEDYELWNERKAVRRGSDEQTIVVGEDENSGEETDGDGEQDKYHEIIRYRFLVFVKGRFSSCEESGVPNWCWLGNEVYKNFGAGECQLWFDQTSEFVEDERRKTHYCPHCGSKVIKPPEV